MAVLGWAVVAQPLLPPLFACVVAADLNRGIGRDNHLPWPRLHGDLRHLKTITATTRQGDAGNAVNAVIMGRRTWESIPPRFRPLSQRLNLVVSRTAQTLPEGALHAGSLDEALGQASAAGVELIFVLGGGQLFAEAVVDPRCQVLYYTRIAGVFTCDTFFPPFEDRFALAEALPPLHEAGVSYQIERWHARAADERAGAFHC